MEFKTGVGKRLDELRSHLNLKKKEFIEELGIHANSYTNYIKERRDLPLELILKLQDKYNISLDWLLKGEGNMKHEEGKVYKSSDYCKIPIYGEIACGSPNEIYDVEPEEMVLVNTEQLAGDIKKHVALRAAGDSMSPLIDTEDIVVLKLEDNWWKAHNKICAVKIGGETTLKRVYLDDEKKCVILNPANPSYKPIVLNEDELMQVQLIGQAVMVVKEV